MGSPSLPKASDIIHLYGLLEHPEGGFFCESYRAPGRIPASALPDGYRGDRSYSTAIYFLLIQGQRSRLHRIQSDELWHFYLGHPLAIIEVTPAGEVRQTILGADIRSGHRLQHCVPGGHWFGAFPLEGGEYSLVGCTVAPGFDFADFELAERESFLRQFPQLQGEGRVAKLL